GAGRARVISPSPQPAASLTARATASGAPRDAAPAARSPAAKVIPAEHLPRERAIAEAGRRLSTPGSAVAVAESPIEPSNSVPPWEDLPPEAFAGETSVPQPASSAAPAPVRPSDAEVERPPARSATAPGSAVPRRAEQPEATVASPGTTGLDIGSAFAAGEWHAILRVLGLGGMMRELAQHCEWIGFVEGVVNLRLSETHRHLLGMNPGLLDRLQDALAAQYGAPLRLRIETGAIAGETPAQRDQAEKRARHIEAVAALESDPFVRELIERFDASLVEASVRPL
ncbi:DNA polymerase III subunit gamma/tau, partial [Aromatoleum aromaticum]|nr:DNA polymerase III subunit gamma/tau [Aromatoleum aromaticum]